MDFGKVYRLEEIGPAQAFHALMAYLRTRPQRFDAAEGLLLDLLNPDCGLRWSVPRGLDEIAIGRYVLEHPRVVS